MQVNPMPGSDNFRRTDRRGFGWDGAQIATRSKAAVHRILRNCKGTKRANSWPHLLPGLQALRRKLRRIRFDECQVSGPPRPTVADIGAAKVIQHPSVILNVLIAQSMDLAFWRAKLPVDVRIKVFLECVSKPQRPGFRGNLSFLISILVHVECVDLLAVYSEFVNEIGDLAIRGPWI